MVGLVHLSRNTELKCHLSPLPPVICIYVELILNYQTCIYIIAKCLIVYNHVKYPILYLENYL